MRMVEMGMSRPIVTRLTVVLAVAAAVFAVQHVSAATVGDWPPAAANGAVQVNTTPTAVPTTPLGVRNAFEIQNLGPNTIYCGFDGGVSSTNGRAIFTNTSWSVDERYSTATAFPKVYCVTTALQVSPSDTRVTEVR